MKRYFGLLLAFFAGLAVLYAQNVADPQQPDHVPIYRVVVVARTIKAINYRHRSESTKVDFRGTSLMPQAIGDADVQSKEGAIRVNVSFKHMQSADSFGPEYMTYVLWAISPEGGSRNLGEIVPDASNRARLRVTTDLQAFGMIVTAEPYAAVRQPSDVVTLENRVRSDTAGKIQQIQPKSELMPRGHYTWQVPEQSQSAASVPKVSMDRYEALLELYQAQNAVAIAQAARAEQYAPDAFAAAQRALSEAQRLNANKGNTKLVVQNAREAAQSAEDARAISERRQEEEQLTGANRAHAQADAQATDRQSHESSANAPDSPRN